MSAGIFIFDTTVNITDCLQVLKKNKIRQLKLLPLTSNFFTQQTLMAALNAHGIQIELIAMPELIDQATQTLEANIHTWSAQLGRTLVGNKPIIEWLALPNKQSSWWFTLLAEKNSVQDNCFFQLAQLNAIQAYLQNTAEIPVFIAIKQRLLRKALLKLLNKNCTQIKKQPVALIAWQQKLKNILSSSHFISILLFGLLHFGLWWRDARCARKTLPPLNTRLRDKQDFLYVSYFPNLDQTALGNGQFVNRYGAALQEMLAALKIPITWLLMPVYYDGHDFPAAMQLAKKMATHGEKFCVLQEFYGFKQLCQGLLRYVQQAAKGIYLWWRLDKKILSNHISTPAALPILKYMWWHSFVGASSARGILFYLNFQAAIQALSPIKTCLYYCEMQAWEKALLMALEQENLPTQTLAFQHTVVMRNFFNYFYQQDYAYRMPMPDKLLVNGASAKNQLQPYFSEQLVEVEAIRHLYLAQPIAKQARDIDLLVIGSYDYQETLNLITLVLTAITPADQLKVWIKGSPVNPVAPILTALNLDARSAQLQISLDNLAQTLPRARMALVANTTVAIEAAACGCEVIIPLFADIMLMNPIIETKANFHIITHPKALRELLKINQPSDSNFQLDSYWHLDKNLPRWRALLEAVVQYDTAQTA